MFLVTNDWFNVVVSGILRSRRDKKQTKKAAKKKKDADSLSNKDENVVVWV